MPDFSNYTEALVSALAFSNKADDIVAKKQSILDEVYTLHNLVPNNILFVGFNPTVLSCRANNISVTMVSQSALDYLSSKKIKFKHIPYNEIGKEKFEAVIAMDEFFTFAAGDQEQQANIQKICSVTTDFIISTLKDYKNQEFKDREFSHPALLRSSSGNKIFTEFHDWDMKDRSAWTTNVYEVNHPANVMTHYGAFSRKTMYFKQLAKFSMDNGASDFLVHKNLMYKSLIKKNYEHVISIRFENGY